MRAMWRQFRCWMGWHNPQGPDGEWVFNKASDCGIEEKCDECGSRLLMDSQGNWFAVRSPSTERKEKM